MKEPTSIIVVIAAIYAITILEGLAIWKGIDGKLFSLAVALIAGLGGYVVPSIFKRIAGK